MLYGLGVAAVAALVVKLLPAVMWLDAAAAITPDQRDLINVLSALVALPAAGWAARPFFIATVRAAATGRLSREAPFTAGLLLAFGLSIVETLNHTAQTSYDSGLVLVAVALAVRTLELAVLQRARASVLHLAAAADEAVTKFVSDTELARVPADSVRPGDLVLVRPGERIAVDGVVTEGRSEIDESRVTGETLPAPAARDNMVHAGTINVSGTLRVRVDAAGAAPPDSVARMSDRAAEAAGCIPLSDRVARLYPTLVLAAALATLAGRLAYGVGWHDATMAALAVLVTTYPAALSLAVSAAEAWAAGALSRAGLLLKSGNAIARLARVDTVLFDKTGTLTLPESDVVNAADIPLERLALAGRLALASRHPLAAAVVRASGATAPLTVTEEPGQGVYCLFRGVPLRLGRPSFCDAERRAGAVLETDPEASVIAFAYGAERHVLAVRQRLRSDAIEAIACLKQEGFAVEMLSGDRAPAVAHAARTLGIERWRAGMTPADKIGHISVLQARGRTVLMVGDGLNDAPSLAAADAALSVGTAAPSALAAADAVFAGDRLVPVSAAIAIARRARQLKRQNLLLAAAWMAVVLSIAITGLATPLAAALAMSGAAVVVTLNALRVGSGQRYSQRNHR
jgi:Cu2+-exporting ATPase